MTPDTTPTERALTADGVRAEIEALRIYGEAKGWDFIKRTEVLRIVSRLDAERAARAEPGLREALESMVYQFAYWSEADPPGHWSGGLSALEEAFAALGWEEPHPAPFQQCDEPGCRKQSSAGTPTLDGYRRTCHDHYPKAGNDAWNAAWRESGLTYSAFVESRRAALEAHGEPQEGER